MDIDGESPVDLDDEALLGLGTGPSAPRAIPERAAARFQPKLKGKIKAESSNLSSTPAHPPPTTIPADKNVEDDVSEGKKDEGDGSAAKKDDAMLEDLDLARVLGDISNGGSIQPMDVDDEEDTIDHEIDVFLNPSLNDHSQLYLMQYVLRPSWRPYELDQRCEVRFNMKQPKIEIDLKLDVDSENYDKDANGPLLEKLTLCSPYEVPLVTQYAVGMLVGRKLYLNPVQGVAQFRPSMTHVDDDGIQKRKDAVESGKMVQGDSPQNIDDTGTWVSLSYFEKENPVSKAYQQKMVTEVPEHIQFTMTPSDFLDSLCPGTSSDSKRTNGLSIRILLSMPLEERLKKWFCEGPQLNRFDALMHLAPNESEEKVLKVLQCYADLVQGLWVSKSFLLYDDDRARARDYFLFQLSKNQVVPSSEIDKVKLLRDSSIQKELLTPLAVKGLRNDWRLKETPDHSFLKKYRTLAESQESTWSSREKLFLDILQPIMKSKPQTVKTSLDASSRGNPGRNTSDVSLVSSRGDTLSSETRDALLKVLDLVLRRQKVCSQMTLVNMLRDFAKALSSRPKTQRSLVDAAKYAATAPFSELQSFLSHVAVNIHGVYVPRSLGNAAIDPFRDMIIELLQQSEPNAMLIRQEIQQSAQKNLKRDITEDEYKTVMQDLCVSTGEGAWTLKNGDSSAR